MPSGETFWRLVKALSYLACGGTASAGCYGFYFGFDPKTDDHTDFDIVLVMISLYMVLFGVLGLMAECKTQTILDRFGFLSSRFGRGLFYFFIGSLSVSSGWDFYQRDREVLTLAVGSLSMLVGLLNILSYCCVESGVEYSVWSASQARMPQRPLLTDVEQID